MKATFAAGCFWHVQEAFDKIRGVINSKVGYTGGTANKATYAEVCSGMTGHAEAIEIEFNEKKVTYKELLTLFFSIHNPTHINRQGVDIGTQYRSAIFYHNSEQKDQAIEYKLKLHKSGKFKSPIATEIVSATKFWPAEVYHQKYYEKKEGTCKI